MPRPRKPNAMKLLHGARKHTINLDEPKFTGLPECPDWLPTLAKDEWHRLMSEFGHLDLVTTVDQSALAAYCQSYALWRQASFDVELHGLILKEPIVSRYTGEITGHRIRKNPAATVLQQERQAMLAAGRLFGLDPASRNSISVPSDDRQPHSDGYDISDFTMPDDEQESSVQ